MAGTPTAPCPGKPRFSQETSLRAMPAPSPGWLLTTSPAARRPEAGASAAPQGTGRAVSLVPPACHSPGAQKTSGTEEAEPQPPLCALSWPQHKRAVVWGPECGIWICGLVPPAPSEPRGKPPVLSGCPKFPPCAITMLPFSWGPFLCPRLPPLSAPAPTPSSCFVLLFCVHFLYSDEKDQK